jgi:hypothetical protein
MGSRRSPADAACSVRHAPDGSGRVLQPPAPSQRLALVRRPGTSEHPAVRAVLISNPSAKMNRWPVRSAREHPAQALFALIAWELVALYLLASRLL